MSWSSRQVSQEQAVEGIKKASIPFEALRDGNYSVILESIGDAEVVLIGEATHGTEEFYRIRAEITKLLIQEKGFNFVAVEADWPDAYRVSRYAKSGVGKGRGAARSRDKNAMSALGDFQRFPRWMWRNYAVVDFIEWLREFNKDRDYPDKVGFYGLDLYALFASAERVIDYLDRVDPPAADKARERYATLFGFREELFEYGLAVATGAVESQERNVVAMLLDLQRKSAEYIEKTGGFMDGDEYFFTEMNAMLVRDAEAYYRNTLRGGVTTWNIRDTHMCDTLQSLIRHYDRRRRTWRPPTEGAEAGTEERAVTPQAVVVEASPPSAIAAAQEAQRGPAPPPPLVGGAPKTPIKAVVWAHNSHIGDAAATRLGQEGEINIGHLVRQRFGLSRCYNIGFTTYTGTVSAARSWGARRETMEIIPGLPGSYEELLHTVFERLSKEWKPAAPQQQPSTAALLQGEQQQQQGGSSGGLTGFGILLRSNNKAASVQPSPDAVNALTQTRLERAIGVQYVKRTERQSHYIPCSMARQFDFVIHIDTTHALKALDG